MKLKSTFEKINSNEVKYTFTVTTKDFDEAKEEAYEKVLKKDFEVKGFRKGFAPMSLYVQHKGYFALQQEALEVLFDKGFQSILEAKKHLVVGNPNVDIDEEILKDGKEITSEFKFYIIIPVLPDVTLGEYKGITLEKDELIVTDDDVDKKIKQEISAKSFLSPKKEGSEVKKGDTTIIDFEGFLNDKPFEGGKAENYSLKIGSNSFIPGFEDQLIGMKAGEEKDINVIFPNEYHEKNLAGKPVIFKIKLHEIKEEKKPKFDDEFVKSLKIKDVTDIISYKKYIKENMTVEKEKLIDDQLHMKALETVAKNAKMDIHPAMIENSVKNQENDQREQMKAYGLTLEQYLEFSKTTIEKFRKDLEKNVIDSIRNLLTIKEICKLENIKAEKSEIDEKVKEYAKKYNLTPVQIKERMGLDSIKEELEYRKGVEFIINNAKIKVIKKENNKK